MMSAENQKEKDLQDKILAKRQQLEFDNNNIASEKEQARANMENPDVAEETKNFNDPADNAADPADLRALKYGENELNDLLNQLGDLDKSK